MTDSRSIPSTAAASTGAWATLREAIRGSAIDLTRASVARATVLLAVPMVLEMFMESLFAVADIFWVSRLGSDAVAAVGLTESMLAIVYALGMGLSAGATAMVARRIGEQQPEQAAIAAVQALAIGVVLSLVVGAAGVVLAPRLLSMMGASPGAVKVGGTFTALMLGGSVTIILLFVSNAVFRGAGDAAAAMRTLWLANGLNILLGPCFIFGWGPFPALGVTGAAVATNIGRGVGVAYQLVSLLRSGRRLSIARRHLHVDWRKLASLLRVGGTASLQTLIETASWIGLVRILASFGSAALAGYTIAIRVVIFALAPAWGMANAAATLVGQNLGAGQPGRAERSVWLVALYNVLFLGMVGAIFAILPRPIVSWFTSEPDVVPVAIDCLRIVSLGFLFFAAGMVLMQGMNGAGDTATPTLINLVCFWLIKIPLAYLLARALGMGPHGVFVAITVAYCAQTISALYFFRRGRWKTLGV